MRIFYRYQASTPDHHSTIALNASRHFSSQESPHLIKMSYLATIILTVLYGINQSYEEGRKTLIYYW